VRRPKVTPGRLLTVGLVLLAIVLALALLPSRQYIFLPDRAHAVAPLVDVPGGKAPARGSVYFVDVIVRKATLLERIFGGLHRGADLYPASAVEPPGVNDRARQRIDLQDMHRSQEIAAAVALKAAGKKVTLRSTGALIDAVEPSMPAAGKLQPDDVITNIDGTRVNDPRDVFNEMSQRDVGDTVRFTIRRGPQTLVVPLKTVPSPTPPRRAIVGVMLEPAIDVQLPIPVRIDTGNVGGPSAGLAFALGVLSELKKNVLHGHRVAATGEIFPDGSVGPIGGIKQKTIGAREAGADVFLVPAGENARDARKAADGLRIVAVKNFPQALRALATLPVTTS
jgi:PDZ domain-containing protein